MEESFFDLVEFLKKPSITETVVDILLCAVPIWLAVMIGLLIGWSWRPRWTGIVFLGLRSKFRFIWTAPPGFGARRLWLAFTALSALSVCRTIWSNFRANAKREPSALLESETSSTSLGEDSSENVASSTEGSEGGQVIVSQNDLEHLIHFLGRKVREVEWQSLMEKSTASMSYQAWRHEPETDPIMYRTKTVFEDASPELVRDFFWDDEYRREWDPMLVHVKILEECPRTGISIVHWIKKFPFFCSDREYVIGRRIWEGGKTYYCVTKGVSYPGLPKRDKPRRVEHYFSGWIIKPVESRKGDGQLTACEVTLLHYEDMGIPKDVAKLGVRHGMWGAVKKLHSGMRRYQNTRKTVSSLSKSALMARNTSKISSCGSLDSLVPSSDDEERGEGLDIKRRKDHGIDWKWLAVGGTVALVCGLHSGAIGRALLLGAGNRIARR